MIISTNRDADIEEFRVLLQNSKDKILNEVQRDPTLVSKIKGTKFEPLVKAKMDEAAIGTQFQGTIEEIGGQRFPDIIADKYFGVEVKTSAQNHWVTTGNSVLETTRVNGVERIFIMYGKMDLTTSNLEVKFRPYEECLSEVVVTHSPRYKIDMNLEHGSTIFDKINQEYDVLRKLENPIEPIINYYREQGGKVWWIQDNEPETSSNLIVQFWSGLSSIQKDMYKTLGYALFPEVIESNGHTKYNDFAEYMITVENIIIPNIRDLYTAGGRQDISVNGGVFNSVPKTICNLVKRMEGVKKVLNQLTDDTAKRYWIKYNPNLTIKENWLNRIDSILNTWDDDARVVPTDELINHFIDILER